MKKNIHKLLCIVLILALTSCNQKKSNPNILFILIDDMGYADVAAFGSDFYETPNIDQLAAGGIKFTDGYASCPVCSPTRASIQTGKYPVKTGITDWIPGRNSRPDELLRGPNDLDHLEAEQITLAEALQEKGYKSISIGKWHLGGDGFLPTDQGYDQNIAGNHRGSPPGYFYPYERGDYALSDLNKNGKPGEYLTDRLTDEAIDFIKANRDSLFLMYLTYYTVHIPLQAKDSLIKKYEKKAEVMPGTRQNNPVYAAMVENLDLNIGKLMETLQDLNLKENTLIFFTSDNGGLSVKEGPHTPATVNYPLRDGKGYLYEGGIRVPLIISWPAQVKNGQIVDQPVASIDYLPTIMDVAGIEVPENIDGVSILPLLTSSGDIPSRDLFWHYPHYSNQGGKPGAVLRSGNYKLITFFEDGRQELYNLEEDISETRNLAAELPELVKEMEQRLTSWQQKMDAQFPVPNPEYQNEAL